MSVEERKKARFKFLEHLYNTVDGDSAYSADMWGLGRELEIGQELISQIVQYLQDEYLIEPRGLGGSIGISHRGIIEIEEAMSYPEKPTEHFLPVNIINIENMNNSAIQQGTHYSSQNIEFNVEDNKRLGELISILNENMNKFDLNDEDRNELVSEKETIESQSKSPKPKSIIIKESLKTIRSLIEGVTASIVAPRVIEIIDKLI